MFFINNVRDKIHRKPLRQDPKHRQPRSDPNLLPPHQAPLKILQRHQDSNPHLQCLRPNQKQSRHISLHRHCGLPLHVHQTVPLLHQPIRRGKRPLSVQVAYCRRLDHVQTQGSAFLYKSSGGTVRNVEESYHEGKEGKLVFFFFDIIGQRLAEWHASGVYQKKFGTFQGK